MMSMCEQISVEKQVQVASVKSQTRICHREKHAAEYERKSPGAYCSVVASPLSSKCFVNCTENTS